MTALKSDTGQGFNIGFPKFRAITEAIWLRRKVGHSSGMRPGPLQGCKAASKAAAGGCAPEGFLLVCTTGFHRALAKWGEEKGIISLPQQHSGAWETGCVHTVPCVGLEGARTVPA